MQNINEDEILMLRAYAFDMIEASLRLKCAAHIQRANILYEGQWMYDYEGYLGQELEELNIRRKQAGVL